MTIDFGLTEPYTRPVSTKVEISPRLYLEQGENQIPWVEYSVVYCNSLLRASLHSGISTARLVYDHGANVKQLGYQDFRVWSPADFVGQFVKVTVDQTGLADPNTGLDFPDIVWVGYIVEEDRERGGVGDDQAGVSKHRVGRQEFRCVGLEWFLTRRQIEDAVHYDETATDGYARIKRPIHFNRGTGGIIDIDYSRRGNKSPVLPAAPHDHPVFVEEMQQERGVRWGGGDVAEYLLYWLTPKDPVGDNRPCNFDLTQAAKSLLNLYYPSYKAQGGTVLHALRTLAPLTRGINGWWVYNEEINTLYLDIDTYALDDVLLPTGGTFPMNSRKHDWPFDTGNPYHDNLMGSPSIKSAVDRKYTSFKARGARRRAVFTVSVPSGNLVTNWEDQEELDYKYAAFILDNLFNKKYAELSEAQKKNRNDAVRKTDIFDQVYQSYAIPIGWDGRSNNGLAEPDPPPPEDINNPDYSRMEFACPIFSESGVIIGGDSFRLSGMRFQRNMPLKVGWDYETSDVSQRPFRVTPVRRTTSKEPGFLPPFAIVATNEEGTKWQYLERMQYPNFEDGEQVQQLTNFRPYRLSVSPTEPSFMVKNVEINHRLAGVDWTGFEPSNAAQELDYRNMRVTLCGEWDAFCEVEVPEDPGAAGQPLEPLVVDLGESYRLDYLAEGTIIRLDGGTPVEARGGLLRDDRAELGDVATIGWEWHRRDRRILSVKISAIRNAIDIGYMITTLGQAETQVELNTMVTAIEYDLLNGGMTVRTDLGELAGTNVGRPPDERGRSNT